MIFVAYFIVLIKLCRFTIFLYTHPRSKMYAYSGEEFGKRAKGVKQSVLKSPFTREDHAHCLVQEESCSRAITTLHSHQHHIYCETTLKTALSPFDSKRYILDDGIHTLFYGHKDIIIRSSCPLIEVPQSVRNIILQYILLYACSQLNISIKVPSSTFLHFPSGLLFLSMRRECCVIN